MVTRMLRVAEVLTHKSGVGAGGDEHRGACVSHVVDPQPLLTDLGDGRVPDTTAEVRSAQWSPAGAEDEALRASVGETPDVVSEQVGNEGRDRNRASLPRLWGHDVESPPDLRQRLTNVDSAAEQVDVLRLQADRLRPAKPSICENVDEADVLLRYDARTDRRPGSPSGIEGGA